MTKTLKELELEHPEWCWKCGCRDRTACESGHLFCGASGEIIASLTAAKRGDEVRIAELEKQLQLRTMAHELDKLGLDKLWRERDSLQSQLTAEQQAHAETKRQLEEARAKLAQKSLPKRLPEGNRQLDREECHTPLSAERQASINRPTDNSPTDDRGEGEK